MKTLLNHDLCIWNYKLIEGTTILTVGACAIVELMCYNIFQYNSGRNTWHGYDFGLLTEDPESTRKTGSGGILYVVF